nr:hypothetical protein [Tanacetum cinerariifolium]
MVMIVNNSSRLSMNRNRVTIRTMMDSNELFKKLLEDLKELTEYNRPIFFDNNENHSVQNKEYSENPSNEIAASNSNKEKEGPQQDSDIRQLIREECCIKVSEEQKLNMEDTILELVKICRQKELLCMHDNELVPILSENEVTLEDKRECDLPVCENSPICDDHFEIFSDSNNDDDISSNDDDFEDIEYVEASLFDPEIVSLAKENIEPDQERLINIMKNDISDDSSNDPLLEEANLFLAFDNSIPPGIENFGNDSKRDICFLEELLIDDSILSHESSDSNFEDNPSVPLPPPEPPDAEFEPDSEEEILGVINDKDEFDDDYSSFMFVIRSKMFLSFLPAESEDTIFDPGFTPHRLKFFVFGYLSRSKRSLHPFFEISLGRSTSLISIA